MTHTDPPTLDYASPPKAGQKPTGPQGTMLFCAGTLTAFLFSDLIVVIIYGRNNVAAWAPAAVIIPIAVVLYGTLFVWASLIRRYPGVVEFTARPIVAYVAGVVAVGLPIIIVTTDVWIHGRFDRSFSWCLILSAFLTAASPWAVYRGRVY